MISSQSTVRPALNHALAVAAAGTFLLEMLLLHVWVGAFTGGWLGDYVLTGALERLGIVANVALVSLAATGLAFAVLVPLLHRIGRVPRDRAVWAVAISWLFAMLVVTGVKSGLSAFVDDALDLELVRSLGGGTVSGAVDYVLTWFWEEALVGAIAVTLLGWLSVRVYRRLRSTDLSASRLGRVPLRPVRLVWAAALLFALLEPTLIRPHWPSVSWAARRTVVGGSTYGFVAQATDFDDDGVGAFDTPRDQAPFDRTQHPFAVDVPGDGVDADGLLGDFRSEDLSDSVRRSIDDRGLRGPLRARQRRNVVVVFLESFRQDLLDQVVNGRRVTPVMTEMVTSGEALRIDAAWASVGYTAPSVTQSFWGSYGRRKKTLLDDLQSDAGYHCGVASGQREDWASIDVDTGLVRAEFFEDARHDEPSFVKGGQRAAGRVLDSVARFLESRPPDRPFFLYVNFQDCHFPYDAFNDSLLGDDLPRRTSLSRGNAAMLRKMYANQAANVDRAIGRLRDQLTKNEAWDDTILVIVSDHGESIYDDGVLGHGTRLTDNQTRIACIVVHPTTDVAAPYTHVNLRTMLRRMLETETVVSNPAVRVAPRRPVLQLIGDVRWPHRLAHVTADGSRVIYDFARGLAIDASTGAQVDLEANDPLAARARDLVRHWEYERWQLDEPAGIALGHR